MASRIALGDGAAETRPREGASAQDETVVIALHFEEWIDAYDAKLGAVC
jgi:hypothetical protein